MMIIVKIALVCMLKIGGENIGSTDSSTLDTISLGIREASIRGGQLLDLMDALRLIFFFFNRTYLLIDGIPIKIEMILAHDVFKLMIKSGVNEEYNLKLVKTALDICYSHIAANIIQAHKNVIHQDEWV